MTNTEAPSDPPAGATHQSEFYGTVSFFRLTHGVHFNSVIDHPVKFKQKTDVWHEWVNGKWIHPGEGWSSRMLKPLNLKPPLSPKETP